jgi:hypothetical protein
MRSDAHLQARLCPSHLRHTEPLKVPGARAEGVGADLRGGEVEGSAGTMQMDLIDSTKRLPPGPMSRRNAIPSTSSSGVSCLKSVLFWTFSPASIVRLHHANRKGQVNRMKVRSVHRTCRLQASHGAWPIRSFDVTGSTVALYRQRRGHPACYLRSRLNQAWWISWVSFRHDLGA